VIAVDSNILVYAYRAEMPQHAAAAAAVRGLSESGKPWVIPWPCAHEFVGKVTNPRIFEKPSTMDEALEQLRAWSESPWFVFLPEAGDHLVHLDDLLRASGAVGPKVHDAKIAAICLGHDVEELWSADRDFRRFPGLRVVNPLVDGGRR
jgi:toxin-antitoxin system PIN domain toxin